MVTQAALRGGDAGQYSSGNGDNGASVHTYIHTHTTWHHMPKTSNLHHWFMDWWTGINTL